LINIDERKQQIQKAGVFSINIGVLKKLHKIKQVSLINTGKRNLSQTSHMMKLPWLVSKSRWVRKVSYQKKTDIYQKKA